MLGDIFTDKTRLQKNKRERKGETIISRLIRAINSNFNERECANDL